ncbi:MAG TPA: 30S ribosomal protein S27ae [Candidatus Nanoarchaeia archaeon]|nr:30S ribosomal protein S27ae [Candidatus Nanoarchaeia archaeon]
MGKTKGAKKVDKVKKDKTKKEGKKLSDLYSISGSKLERKNKICPKCGPGMFMAVHSNRLVCGKCKYTEYQKKN